MLFLSLTWAKRYIFVQLFIWIRLYETVKTAMLWELTHLTNKSVAWVIEPMLQYMCAGWPYIFWENALFAEKNFSYTVRNLVYHKLNKILSINCCACQNTLKSWKRRKNCDCISILLFYTCQIFFSQVNKFHTFTIVSILWNIEKRIWQAWQNYFITLIIRPFSIIM